MIALFSWWLQNGPQDFDFSIAMGADYSFRVKNIEIWAPAFFKHMTYLRVPTSLLINFS